VTGAATDLYDLADEVLSVCEAALALLPAGVPARSYVAHGLPAIDCEQLTVSVFTVPQADTSPRSLPLDRQFKVSKFGSLNLIFLTVQLVRCYPPVTASGRQQNLAPRVEDLTAFSQLIYADGWQLWNGLQTAKRLGAFAGTCREFSLDPLLPIQPQGGFAGWAVPIEVQLDGFNVAFPSVP
jgi:hypothetical protein